MKARTFTVIALCITTVFAAKGVDVSSYTTAFSCLYDKGYEFVGIQGYKNGLVDPNVVANIRNANRAPFSYIDIFVSPCGMVCRKRAVSQAQELVSAVRGEPYDNIWIVIGSHWSNDKDSNKLLLLEMAREFQRLGQKVGIATSYYNWEQTLGADWSEMSDLPL